MANRLSRSRARELGRLGGQAKAAKMRAAKGAPAPFAGTDPRRNARGIRGSAAPSAPRPAGPHGGRQLHDARVLEDDAFREGCMCGGTTPRGTPLAPSLATKVQVPEQ